MLRPSTSKAASAPAAAPWTSARFDSSRAPARSHTHEVPAFRLVLEHDRADRVDNQLQKNDMDRRKHRRPADRNRNHGGGYRWNVNGNCVDDCLREIGVDMPSQPDR